FFGFSVTGGPFRRRGGIGLGLDLEDRGRGGCGGRRAPGGTRRRGQLLAGERRDGEPARERVERLGCGRLRDLGLRLRRERRDDEAEDRDDEQRERRVDEELTVDLAELDDAL